MFGGYDVLKMAELTIKYESAACLTNAFSHLVRMMFNTIDEEPQNYTKFLLGCNIPEHTMTQPQQPK